MRKNTRPGRDGRNRFGFTLIELLVVISILALLIAILVPGLRGARRVSKRAACGGNLHSIGQALRMYLNDSNDYLPVVENLPSIPHDDDHPRPAIATVLRPYVQKAGAPQTDAETELTREGDEVFHCPADTPGKTERGDPNIGKSFFQSEKSSYCFNIRLHMLRDSVSFTDGTFDDPVKLTEIVNSERAKHYYGSKPAEEEIWLLRDYVPFHGEAGKPASTNYLYVNGRVADLER